MPIAFFNRTRTGALVSRLNNDVIGAQRTFSDTFAGIISNTVTLLLALIAMLALSWQITVGALLLLPVFLLPARRIGAKLAGLQREKSAHNAAMGSRMTERFSAPGATLIKLFGRPSRESAEFAARAARVRDIGVRSAMVQETFYLALMLVSALALALIYGLGGVFALRGQIEAGSVVALAMLLTRLYAPLTALANTRVELMSAMVSFERVFEVLDLRRWSPTATTPDRCRPARSMWSSTVSASPTPPPTAPRWHRSRRSRCSIRVPERKSSTTCRSTCRRARRSRWWAARVPGSRRSSRWCQEVLKR